MAFTSKDCTEHSPVATCFSLIGCNILSLINIAKSCYMYCRLQGSSFLPEEYSYMSYLL